MCYSIKQIFLNWMKQGEGRALRFDVKKCVTKGLTETGMMNVYT